MRDAYEQPGPLGGVLVLVCDLQYVCVNSEGVWAVLAPNMERL